MLNHVQMNSKITIKIKLIILQMKIISTNICLHHPVFRTKKIHTIQVIFQRFQFKKSSRITMIKTDI